MSAASNADELTQLAFENCIFPVADQRIVREQGPTIYVAADGIALTDSHGVTRLDMMGSHTRANSLGYGNREIATAVFEQMSAVHYVGTTSHFAEPTLRLAGNSPNWRPDG